MRVAVRTTCAIFLLVFLFTVPARASEVTDLVKGTIDKVLNVLNDPAMQGPEKKAERRRRVMDIIAKRFDFEELSKRTLALHWRERTEEERKEFVRLYTRFLQDFYMDKIEDNRDQKVVYTGEIKKGNKVEVRTLVVTDKGVEIPINYRLLRRADDWKVYDVVIEGVSLVMSYRSQFSEVIQRSSYEGLVETLKEKTGLE